MKQEKTLIRQRANKFQTDGGTLTRGFETEGGAFTRGWQTEDGALPNKCKR